MPYKYISTIKPSTFCARGRQSLVKALFEELKSMGYTTYSGDYSLDNSTLKEPALCVDEDDPAGREEFSRLVAIDAKGDVDKLFELPKDFNEVIDFARNQINSDYWNFTKLKTGDFIIMSPKAEATKELTPDTIYEVESIVKILGKIKIKGKDSLYDATCFVVPSKDYLDKIRLSEAIKKFPIGCKFYPVTIGGDISSSTVIEQKIQCKHYKDGDNVWIVGSANIYNPVHNKWAKLIEGDEVEIGGIAFIVSNSHFITGVADGTKFSKSELEYTQNYLRKIPRLMGSASQDKLMQEVDMVLKKMIEYGSK